MIALLRRIPEIFSSRGPRTPSITKTPDFDSFPWGEFAQIVCSKKYLFFQCKNPSRSFPNSKKSPRYAFWIRNVCLTVNEFCILKWKSIKTCSTYIIWGVAKKKVPIFGEEKIAQMETGQKRNQSPSQSTNKLYNWNLCIIPFQTSIAYLGVLG